jgi:hypothetical protein
MPMSDNFADWQAQASADEIIVRLCLDRSVYRRYIEAAAALEAYRPGTSEGESQTLLDGPAEVSDDDLSAMMRAVVEADDQLRQAEKTFRFRQIRWADYQKLVADHPSVDGDRYAERFASLGDVNHTTFWPALLAACNLEPGLTVEQATWLRDGDAEWPGLPGQKWEELVLAVWTVNVGGSSIPKSVLSTADPLRRVLSSITPSTTASPSPSSEDG